MKFRFIPLILFCSLLVLGCGGRAPAAAAKKPSSAASAKKGATKTPKAAAAASKPANGTKVAAATTPKTASTRPKPVRPPSPASRPAEPEEGEAPAAGASPSVAAGAADPATKGSTDPAAAGAKPKGGAEKAPGPPPDLPWAELAPMAVLTAEITDMMDGLVKPMESVRSYDKEFDVVHQQAGFLAVLIAGAALHPDPVPWKGSAPAAQQAAIALLNASTSKGGDAYRAASQAHTSLRAALASTSAGTAAAPSLNRDWAQLIELAGLMKRVEKSHNRVRSGLANQAKFDQSRDTLAREATVLAMLAAVAACPDESADDAAAFYKFAGNMKQFASEVRQATADKQFDKALKASTANHNNCNKCHEKFRFEGGGF